MAQISNDTSKISKLSEYLGLNIGPSSTNFEATHVPAPRVIPNLDGPTLSDLFAGLSLRYESVAQQFEEAEKIVSWVVDQIDNQGFDPFMDQLPQMRLSRSIRKNLKASQRAMLEAANHTREQAEFYVVNGQYLVSTMNSTLPHAVRNMYDYADHGTVNFAVVYNRAFPGRNQTTYKKMFIGANTMADSARQSLVKLVAQNRTEANRLYEVNGMAFVSSKLTLDIVVAVMMAANLDFNPPHVLLDYVESVTWGSFENRANVELPSLEDLEPKLQELETAPGTWGGHPAGVTLGSPRDLDTSVYRIETILETMAESFPVKDGYERGYVKVS